MFIKPSEPFDGSKMQSEFNIQYNNIHDKLLVYMGMIKAGIISNLLNSENCKIDIVNKHSTFLHIIGNVIILKALRDDNIDDLRMGVNMMHIVCRLFELTHDDIEESLKVAHLLVPYEPNDSKARVELVEREMNRSRAIYNSVIRPNRDDLLSEVLCRLGD
jgi:hypothetical protein